VCKKHIAIKTNHRFANGPHIRINSFLTELVVQLYSFAPKTEILSLGLIPNSKQAVICPIS